MTSNYPTSTCSLHCDFTAAVYRQKNRCFEVLGHYIWEMEVFVTTSKAEIRDTKDCIPGKNYRVFGLLSPVGHQEGG